MGDVIEDLVKFLDDRARLIDKDYMKRAAAIKSGKQDPGMSDAVKKIIREGREP